MCPSSGADDCVVLSPRVGIVPWLQEGCQNRLAGSVSIEEFVAQLNFSWQVFRKFRHIKLYVNPSSGDGVLITFSSCNENSP